MANTLKVKRSATPAKVPTTSDLQLGEIAVNTYDGKMYIKKNDGTDAIVQIGGTAGSGDVVGPASATDNAIARFDSTTGKLIQNSAVTVSDTGAMAGVLSITDPNFIDFNTGYTTPVTAGQLGWDGTFNSLALGMIGGNVIQHIGEDTYIYVKASSAITRGQVVMFTGSVGASGVATAAPSTGVTNGQTIIGVAAESIALNGFGLIQTYGELRNVNTSAFADGDILYYNSAVTGGFTTTYPSSGPIVTVAAVLNGGSAGGGVITVRVSVTQRLTASTGISVSQTSTGSTITNTGVTSVTGTSPVVSSGGATPAISMPAATTSVNGYLTSTDWNTFNNKTSNTGTVTSVAATAGTGISITGSPITTSGTLTITNTAPDQVVALTGAGATSISGTYPNFTISSVNTTYALATSTTLGLIELGSDTAQTVAANAVTATASRSYALQVNAAGQGVINVPWTDTNSGGTVTSVSGTGTASGLSLSGTVTTSGNITLSGTVNSLAAGSYGISITGSSASCTGNAATATTLQTARTIQGVSFNGSANITVATAGTGIGVSGTTITNNGVTSIVAGTNITISGGTGAVTINASGGSPPTTYGAVGTYVYAGVAAVLSPGSTYSGSDLSYSTSGGYFSSWAGYVLIRVGEYASLGLSGTWRALSYSTNNGSYIGTALFVRVS
jgi:hypothetical protein